MEIHLISYGDQKYELRSGYFKALAIASSFFDQVTIFRYEDLDIKFVDEFYEVLQFTRGGGYIWKPYFIKRALQDLKDGDILVYCDTGCHFNKMGKERFNQYLDLLNQSETGVLAFQLNQKEYEYTKREVFDHFGSSPAVIESDQLMAAIILLKKCDYAVQLIDLWSNAVKEHPDLFTDDTDNDIQHPDFIDHKHDQSVWSILLKTHGAEIIPDETYFDGSEKQGVSFPLWASRIVPMD